MNRFKSSLMSRSGSGLMLSLGEYTTSDNEFSNTGGYSNTCTGWHCAGGLRLRCVAFYLGLSPCFPCDPKFEFSGDEIEGGSSSRLLAPTPSGILGKKPISGESFSLCLYVVFRHKQSIDGCRVSGFLFLEIFFKWLV